ncbi:electron transfer flavoprotein subunit beta/FixA family protein [Membranicola marinus]|uniref:Electron transfer flavoprotein subunit beta n=1 Tax=Membranihabitans marinus TaxID=1227546 RepID=A0A953HRZ8_9BACT|nr:electron transfer flavoprotein subunit beta/FixA family protein [Membranihabitans marinus]MBY5957290.1 electron transfer flavoprotein subunit beta/FixA family protein [Membranihabitans marinus]
MKIIVCVARAIETTAKIKFNDDNTAFDDQGVQYIMNPYDEWYGLVRALELKEQHGGDVTVLHVGGEASDQIIRKALAIGADQAIRINHEPESAETTAFLLANQLKTMEYDLIFTGQETVDYNGGMVPPMLSAHLKLPFVGIASHLDVTNKEATITRQIEGGVEIVQASLPLVVSATKDLAEQRIPNMRGIMMAKRKPIDVVEPESYESKSSMNKFHLPSKEKKITYVDPEDMDELVRLLHEEAKVI